jgi:hypothetical protein
MLYSLENDMNTQLNFISNVIDPTELHTSTKDLAHETH